MPSHHNYTHYLILSFFLLFAITLLECVWHLCISSVGLLHILAADCSSCRMSNLHPLLDQSIPRKKPKVDHGGDEPTATPLTSSASSSAGVRQTGTSPSTTSWKAVWNKISQLLDRQGDRMQKALGNRPFSLKLTGWVIWCLSSWKSDVSGTRIVFLVEPTWIVPHFHM